MSANPRKVVGMFAVLLGVWVGVYWLYKKADPPIVFDEVTAPPLETQPLAAVDSLPGEQPSKAARPARNVVEKPRFTSYVVRKGDTSWESISRRVYGDRKHWKAIAESNPLVTASKLIVDVTELKIPVDPTNIQGRVVTLPAKPEVPAKPGKTPETVRKAETGTKGTPTKEVPQREDEKTAVAMTEYVVREGDTLSGIAKSVYGKSAMWERIFEANRDKLAAPEKVKKGMVLKIPAGS